MRPGRHIASGFLRAIILAGCMLVCAHAADDNTIISPRSGGAKGAETAAPTVGGTMHSMSLVVGLALAAVGGWLVWRNRRGTPIGKDPRALAVEETRSLGNRQFLVVASYEGRKFLLGVCPGRIEMLAPLDGTSAAAREKARE